LQLHGVAYQRTGTHRRHVPPATVGIGWPNPVVYVLLATDGPARVGLSVVSTSGPARVDARAAIEIMALEWVTPAAPI